MGSEDKFENDVKTYGTQANFSNYTFATLFENDVKTYGTQAAKYGFSFITSLRMM